MNNVKNFQENIWDFYKYHRREFAWRNTQNPYHILVSEIMLQQTQTLRVVDKYEKFIKTFPDFSTLAQAHTQNLLIAWQGLGYNRRALALRAIAQEVMNNFNGVLPDVPEVLKRFKGIGPNTAGSICAFAFNKPVAFIETNIRAVFIYHFFQGKTEIHDKEILPLVHQTVDRSNPREWYYALMDYGVMIKKEFKNPANKSIHYAKQSKFEGSDRQIRGNILKILAQKWPEGVAMDHLITMLNIDSQRLDRIIQQLTIENFLSINQQVIKLQ